MVGASFGSGKAWTPGEFMVEVVGPDGLKHHVGPFKSRQEAKAWIAQNPSDSSPNQTPPADTLPHSKRGRRRTVE